MKLNARQLREVGEKDVKGKLKNIQRHPIYFILENIYDTYNVGGLFRLADAIAVEKIYLCGQTEIPPNSKIKKASIGTYKVVPWEYKRSSEEVINELRKISKSQFPISKQIPIANYQLPITFVAVEQHPQAIPYIQVGYQLPLALVFGNETTGILPETLKMVDQIVEIPMWGINKSLNVIVSAAVVSYWVMNKI